MNTIVALATPFGRSGIAVIRLSGEDSLRITRRLIADETFDPQPRFASLKKIIDSETKEVIDEVIVTFFNNPHSFTGEDVVEISCHGAPILIRQIIDICLKSDARMAEPGEFSLRALSNGRINLSQAEAIKDLIDSRTVSSARQSVRQLRGELSEQLQPLKDELLNVIIVLESTLEFVEDDLPEIQIENIKQKLVSISNKIDEMAATFQTGRLLREGIKVAIVGRPNVGKSSIFNSLVGLDRAIVTDIAGTTRDSLYEDLSIDGIPITLIDTAGIRETSDTIESIGVKRAKGTLADADLVVLVSSHAESITGSDSEILQEIEGLNYIIIVNKIDLLDDFKAPVFELDESKVVYTSAKTGAGIKDLKQKIISSFNAQHTENTGFIIINARHKDALARAGSEIKKSYDLLDSSVSEEFILVGLHNALNILGQITGETTTEDMLTRIFSTFCIGK